MSIVKTLTIAGLVGAMLGVLAIVAVVEVVLPRMGY